MVPAIESRTRNDEHGENAMKKTFAIALITTAFAALLGSVAQAADLRSWDQKVAPNNRFVVLSKFNNEAVLDTETQLVWMREPTGNENGIYHGAYFFSYNQCLIATDGGRRGWRLPGIHELLSLIGDGGVVQAGVFKNIDTFLWTGTAGFGHIGSSYRMVANLTNGLAGQEDENTYGMMATLCVRGHSSQP